MISIFLFFKNFLSIKILFGLIELNIIINKMILTMKFYAPNQISIHGIQKNIFLYLYSDKNHFYVYYAYQSNNKSN